MNLTSNFEKPNIIKNDINIHYHKRKNGELFKSVENPEILFLSNTQNYIPVYNRFFSLNNSNFNSINFNHKWYLYDIKNKINVENTKNLFHCRVKNIDNDEIKNKNIFIKLAPLLDPFKYLVGKYSNISDEQLCYLPVLNNNNNNNNHDKCHHKVLDANNSAYIDGLFVYLSSILKNNYKFNHGLEYYGSFLSVKNNFLLNVFDDLEYLNQSDFFNKNKNVLFKIDNYEHLIKNENQKPPITIDYTSSFNSKLSINSIDNKLYDDLFNDSSVTTTCIDNTITEYNLDINNEKMTTLNSSTKNSSSSSCSSRESYTNSEVSEILEDISNPDSCYKSESEWEDIDSNQDDSSDESCFNEEEINVTINKFPVELICMENCENTLDNLILNNELFDEEWFSILMQVIMILISYQKAFSFTHNDLHTNNIMYNETSKKYIIYYYNKKIYKVPTFGKIFKIIDFGRSIYKFQGKLFCSDSFQNGNDAASQYNTEPYFDNKKPRLDPNFSFDLCRLACSIFDYLIEDLEEVKNIDEITNPVKKLIVEWCLDDKGINLLYKNNGDERYPDFKLYKMIARHVHNHTPQAQLERSEFQQFIIKEDLQEHNNFIKINIDKIPILI
jgi:hypothetical protein